MNTERVVDPALAAVDRVVTPRWIAIAGIAGVLWAYLSVLHRAVVILGDPTALYAVVAVAAVAGALLSRLVTTRTAIQIGAVGTALCLLVYLRTLPGGASFLVLVWPMLGDVLSLLGGLSVLRIVNADVWALTAAPGPVFLTTYLALRGRYAGATAVAGAALGFVVLTGDLTTTATAAGVVGALAGVAFGDCDRRGERLREADGTVVAIAALLAAALVAGAAPVAADSVGAAPGGGTPTMEADLVYAGDTVSISGPIQLSPEVRYRVQADEEAYWRVASYDRYTGDGWVRSQGGSAGDGLASPPGDSRTLEQEYTAEADIATLPAAWRATDVSGVPVPVQVAGNGDLEPASPLAEGESYDVTSEVPTASPGQLRSAGTEYPDEVEERYTQLPASTPDRVGDRTERLTANADNPYDTARVIEEWLKEEYRYSLEVERPEGDIADAFLFEMDAGYCTYYATTMVAMLRTQGIPARFVTGYSPGQQVDDDEWVVRGSNAHAWVEVYFPGHGWIEFDPTPAADRSSTEQERIDEARLEGSEAVDIDLTENQSAAAIGPEEDPLVGAGETELQEEEGTGATNGESVDGSDGISVPVPSREQVGIAIGVTLFTLVGARRLGVDRRLRRQVWLRRLPDDDPDRTVIGLYRRLLVLEDRPKRPSETPRAYLADADERAKRIGSLYERAKYGNGVDVEEVTSATAAYESLLEERVRVPRLLNRRGGSR